VFYVDAHIFAGFGHPAIEVVRNEVAVERPGWDSNFNDQACEVVNDNNAVVFQMIRKNDELIVVNGVFPVSNGVLVATPQGVQHVQTGWPVNSGLKKLFKYPSWRFEGQHAE
jgi:hypothetical protein